LRLSWFQLPHFKIRAYIAGVSRAAASVVLAVLAVSHFKHLRPQLGVLALHCSRISCGYHKLASRQEARNNCVFIGSRCIAHSPPPFAKHILMGDIFLVALVALTTRNICTAAQMLEFHRAY